MMTGTMRRIFEVPLGMLPIDDILSITFNLKPPKPKHIYKNDDVTTVLWDDGTKTIVKCSEGDKPDDYHAFCAALAKKMYGTGTAVKKFVAMTVDQKEKRKKNDRVADI